MNWRRVGLTTLIALLATVLTAGATAGALLWYGELKLDRVVVPGLQVPGDIDRDGVVDIQEIADVRNVLVVGSDSRDDLDPKERRRLGLGEFEGTRTDTIFIVQLDPGRDVAAILSFPRDLLVTLCDGSEGRINGAFEIGKLSDVGGPACLVQTVHQLTNIPIHHYVQIDFSGFVQFVDRLGGVRMYLDEPIVDEDAHVDLKAGCQVLNGAEALGFVRVRKIDSDFGRIARQQRFIREIVEQISSARIALDVPRLFKLVDAGAQAVETDKSLSLGVMRRIAFSLRELSSDRIDSRTVPAYNRDINGVAYVVADDEKATALFEAFARGEAAPKDVGTEGPTDVKVRDVPPVAVANGSGRANAATSIAEGLRGVGFEIASLENFPDRVPTTYIQHPQGRKEEAQLIAKAIGGATLLRGEDEQLRLVIGRNMRVDQVLTQLDREADRQASEPPEPEPTPEYAGADDTQRRDC